MNDKVSSDSDGKSEARSVTVRIMGREYTVMCPAEEHEALVASADYLNERMTAISGIGTTLQRHAGGRGG